MGERQEILHLWLAAAALDTDVKAWAHHDGIGEGDRSTRFHGTEPPYRTGVDALRDGWFLLQAPGPLDAEATNGELPWEFVFERRHRIDDELSGRPNHSLARLDQSSGDSASGASATGASTSSTPAGTRPGSPIPCTGIDRPVLPEADR